MLIKLNWAWRIEWSLFHLFLKQSFFKHTEHYRDFMGITPSVQKKESRQQVVPLLKNQETHLKNT